MSARRFFALGLLVGMPMGVVLTGLVVLTWLVLATMGQGR